MTGRTVHLDTANWISLSQSSSDQATFASAVEAGSIVPVLALAHLIELSQIQRQATRYRVASCIEAVTKEGQVLWIHPDIVKREALAAFCTLFSGEPQSPIRFASSYHETHPIPLSRSS